MMKNVLVVSGHPDLAQSIANVTILDEVKKQLPQAHIRKLDELYPNDLFNIQDEQQALRAADIIVWQFPFHWYALPAKMKKWLDDVFLHGFSHGSKAQLGGKKLILSFTTGAPAMLYHENAAMKHSIEALLAPFESLAALCNLELQEPIYTTGVSYLARENEEELKQQYTNAKNHAEKLVKLIKSLNA